MTYPHCAPCGDMQVSDARARVFFFFERFVHVHTCFQCVFGSMIYSCSAVQLSVALALYTFA